MANDFGLGDAQWDYDHELPEDREYRRSRRRSPEDEDDEDEDTTEFGTGVFSEDERD